MVIVDTLKVYGDWFVSGKAMAAYKKMDNTTALDTALKTFAVAMLVGIIAAFILPASLIILTIELAAFFMFVHDTMKWEEAAAKKGRKA